MQHFRAAAPARSALSEAASLLAHRERGPGTGEPQLAAWQLLTSGQAGPETLSTIARGFIQPEHGDLLAPYAGRYLAAIEDLWAKSSAHQRVQLGTLLFPYPAASPELLTMIEEFLAAAPRDPALAGCSAITRTQSSGR